jgi:diguanylate cyclase (GGDEF)-like protein
MLEAAAEGAVEALLAASVSISRQEPGTGTVRTLINVGRLGPSEERWPENEVYLVEDFFVGQVWAGMSAQFAVGELRILMVSVDDPDADPQEVSVLRSLDKASSISAPLVVDGRLWGELYATREAGVEPFDSTDEAYTEALSAILAGAISRSVTVDSLERMAFVDPLTGLANRRALDTAAETAFGGFAGRSGRRVSVVSLDVNGLKLLNDSMGHSEGDQLLTQVSRLLQRNFAGLHGSMVARVGGDEFTVLIPGHSIDSVVAAATSACAEARSLPLGGGVSCGVATTIERGAEAGRTLLVAADAAQYVAKQQDSEVPVAADHPYGYELMTSLLGLPYARSRPVPLRHRSWTQGLAAQA